MDPGEELDPSTIGEIQSQIANISLVLDALAKSNSDNGRISADLWKLQAAFFVFLMQVGFSLIEAGTVRVKNTRNIMVKNVLDMCICVISFWLFGYAIGFGYGNEVIGWKYSDGKPAFSGDREQLKFFFELAFATTCANIIAGSIAERTQLRAYLIYSFFLSSFIYPITAHLIWSKKGLLSANSSARILGTDGVLDNAGSMVVHVTGGVTALVGAWMVGPRIGRFDIEGNPVPMQSHSVALVAAGTVLLWVSFFGFNTGPVDIIQDQNVVWTVELARVAQNTTLTAAFSGFVVYIFTQTVNKKSKPEDVFNAVIGGLVAACATSSVVQPYGAAVIGLISGFVYLAGVKVMIKCQIDDVVMAAPVHLFCGTWGGLAVGLFSTPYNIRKSFNIIHPRSYGLFHGGGFRQLFVQMVGLFTVYLWVGISSFVLFYLLAFFNALRVDRQEEEAGLDLAFHGGEDKDTTEFLRRDPRSRIDFVRDRKIFSVGQFRRIKAVLLPRKGDRSLKSSLWHKSLKRTAFGEFSFAMYEANYFMEDTGEVEATLSGVYLGIHDGHGGTEASKYLKDHLYDNLKSRFVQNHGKVSVEGIKAAFASTEGQFIDIVRDAFQKSPHLATVGSCSIVAIITGETLFIANLGDSRAVLGCRGKDGLYPVQLSQDDNVNMPDVREAYNRAHEACCGGNLVWEKNGIWRIKGKIQVTRCFGDLFMKHLEFNRDPLFSRFRVPGPFVPPLVSSEPSVSLHMLSANDEFLILASDGLWEYVSNEEAVEIVSAHGRKDIARFLVKYALQKAARKHEVAYSELLQMPGGQRRDYHDDMTVIVFFFRHGTKQRNEAAEVWKQSLSLKGGDAAKDVLAATHLPANLRLRYADSRRQADGTSLQGERVGETILEL